MMQKLVPRGLNEKIVANLLGQVKIKRKKLKCGSGTVITTFWPDEEMGRNQDGLGGYTCNVLLDRLCAWIWAK